MGRGLALTLTAAALMASAGAAFGAPMTASGSDPHEGGRTWDISSVAGTVDPDAGTASFTVGFHEPMSLPAMKGSGRVPNVLVVDVLPDCSAGPVPGEVASSGGPGVLHLAVLEGESFRVDNSSVASPQPKVGVPTQNPLSAELQVAPDRRSLSVSVSGAPFPWVKPICMRVTTGSQAFSQNGVASKKSTDVALALFVVPPGPLALTVRAAKPGQRYELRRTTVARVRCQTACVVNDSTTLNVAGHSVRFDDALQGCGTIRAGGSATCRLGQTDTSDRFNTPPRLRRRAKGVLTVKLLATDIYGRQQTKRVKLGVLVEAAKFYKRYFDAN